MIKNKKKGFLVILIGLFILNIHGVNAGFRASISSSNRSNENLEWCYYAEGCGRNARWTGGYEGHMFNLKFDNTEQTYEAYCIDPQRDAATSVICEATNASPAMGSLLKYLHDHSEIDISVKVMAVRLLAWHEGISQRYDVGSGTIKYIITKWHTDREQAFNNIDKTKAHLFFNPSWIVEDAVDLIIQAENGNLNGTNVTNNTQNNSSNHGTNVLSFSNKRVITNTAQQYVVTYDLTSSENLPQLELVCKESNCSVELMNWTGSSGEARVTLNGDLNKCSYSLLAYYDGRIRDNDNNEDGPYSKIFICKHYGSDSGSTSNPNTNTHVDYTPDSVTYDQWFIPDVDAGNISEYVSQSEDVDIYENQNESTYLGGYGDGNSTYDEWNADQEFTDMATNGPGDDTDPQGPYYKKWCDDGCSEREDGHTKLNQDIICDEEGNLIIGGPTDAACVIGHSDEAGYTYQDTSVVEGNNPYCSVWCKEDYEMKMPGINNSNKNTHDPSNVSSGTYFTLKNTVVKAVRTCYVTSPINDEGGIKVGKFTEDANAAQAAIENAKNSGADISEVYARINDLKRITGQMQDCASLLDTSKDNYCYNPDVNFDYHENQASSEINIEKLGQVTDTTTNINAGVATGQVQYTSYNWNGTDWIPEPIFVNIPPKNNPKDPNEYYYTKTIEKNAEYNTQQDYWAYIPTGSIEGAPSGTQKEQYYYLGQVFPVAIQTTRGAYNWTLNFKQIGQFNGNTQCEGGKADASKLGRLNEVVKAIGKSDGLSSNIGYVCLYIVNCPDCPPECSIEDLQQYLLPGQVAYKRVEEDGTVICGIEEDDNDPKCNDCDIYCVNCIYDGSDAYNYRTISLTDMNPNSRDLGVNWTNEKGQATLKEIEKSGEGAYTKAEYSYTITPSQMKAIRDYNNTQKNYSSAYLDYDKDGNGKSAFLRDTGTKYFKSNKTNDKWTVWSKYDENDTTSAVGPAWK